MQSVISQREIPKDLQGISGVQTGFDIPTVQQSRLVITGQPGAGKSTFLNSNPHLISLDPEQGGRTVADPQALRFTPPANTDPAQLDKAYLAFADKLIARKLGGRDDFKMVCVDSLDELIGIFQRALCLRAATDGMIPEIGDIGGGHGKGYAMVRESIFGMLDKIHRAGLGWACIAHTTIKTVTVDNKEVQVSGLAMSQSYMSALFRKCEHMMFIEHGIQVVPGKMVPVIVGARTINKPGKSTNQRVRKLKTRPGGLWQGGSTNDVKVRVPLKNEYILPKVGGWGLFAEAYEEACNLLTAGNNDPCAEQG